MNNLTKLTNLQRELGYQLTRVGMAGWVGLTLFVATAIVFVTLVLPASERIAKQEAELAALAAKSKARVEGDGNLPPTPTEQLAAFYREFPSGAAVPDWLGKLYAVAEDQEIELDKGDYVLSRIAAGRLDQFRITLPIEATYPQIREFITATLETAPALALEGVSFKREAVDEDLVSARVVFRLYLEKGV